MKKRPRHFVPVFRHWQNYDTLKVWQIASMMRGIEPRLLGDVVVNMEGDALDLSEEIEQIQAAVMAGTLVAFPAAPVKPEEATEIVVSGLIPWLRSHGHRPLAKSLAPLQVRAAASPSAAPAQAVSGPAPAHPSGISSQPVARLSAARTQELLVLTALKAAGHDPKCLPKAPPGKAGVKAETRKALGTRGEWAKTTVFKKAWDELRKTGEIADQP